MGEDKMVCVVGLDRGKRNSSQPKKRWKALGSYGSL